MEGIVLLVSLLLRKGGFSSLSSAVVVVCPFYTKECFVLGLSLCLSRDIKSIRGACGVFLLWGWGNTFLFVRSLLLILRRLIWRKSLLLGETRQSNNLEYEYVPEYYKRNQSCSTGRNTVETGNGGRNATSSMEEGCVDVVHMNVTSVTTPEVTSSLMLPSATQLDMDSRPAIIEELVLPKSTPIINEFNSINAPSISVEVLKEETFVAKINNNEELLLAWTFIPDLESTNQLARTIGVNPINALNKSSMGNQFQEVAQSNPNAETNSPNFLSREEHNFTRATKKTSTWTRLDRRKNTQQAAQADFTGACKQLSSAIDDRPELPCSKKQVLKDGAEFSFQMGEADEQPCQES